MLHEFLFLVPLLVYRLILCISFLFFPLTVEGGLESQQITSEHTKTMCQPAGTDLRVKSPLIPSLNN